MKKTCPRHGTFDSPYWDDLEHYLWCNQFAKPGTPKGRQTIIEKGCPSDCGLCPSHQQHTCLAILDVTDRCNLSCHYCFASSTTTGEDRTLEDIHAMYQTVRQSEREPTPIQLSGGEPTLRRDLSQIIEMGDTNGFSHIEVNTNGFLLAQNEHLIKDLKNAGMSCLYLQFDGVTSDVYTALRGTDLLDLKKKTISHCRKHKVPVVLVPTIVNGVNDHQLGDIIRFALANNDVIRGISIQPLSQLGRYQPGSHISLAGVVKRIAQQTTFLTMYDFYPIPCPSPHCSNISLLIVDGDDIVPVTRLIDADTYLDGVSTALKASTLVDMLIDGANAEIAEDIVCSCGLTIPGAVKKILDHTLFITMMGFMDAYTMDLQRLAKCCIHVATPEHQLIPFCAYNLTNTQGSYLYRQPKNAVVRKQ
jgi:uncharacterized radical SAM superfamily Fe-S cluster-containing enzyme